MTIKFICVCPIIVCVRLVVWRINVYQVKLLRVFWHYCFHYIQIVTDIESVCGLCVFFYCENQARPNLYMVQTSHELYF